MKAKALKVGFINGSLVQVGQEVEVPDGTKASWLVPVEEFKAPAKAKPKAQPATLAELAKAPVSDSLA